LGAWDLVDVDSPQKLGDGGGGAEVLKGKDRRKWRESEVEFLDLS
jgi:Holliday junction resolvase YEN1